MRLFASSLALAAALAVPLFAAPVKIISGDMTISGQPIDVLRVPNGKGIEIDLQTVDSLVTQFRVTLSYSHADGTPDSVLTQTVDRQNIGDTRLVFFTGTAGAPASIFVQEIKGSSISPHELLH